MPPIAATRPLGDKSAASLCFRDLFPTIGLPIRGTFRSIRPSQGHRSAASKVFIAAGSPPPEGNVVKKSYSSLFVKSAVALAMAAPMLASAESDITIGGVAPTTASARLDFRVVIPRVLLLQVGSNDATVNLVEFDLGTTEPGAGGTIGRTNGAAVPVRVMGNAGNIGLSATTTGALGDGSGNSISFAKITASTSNPDLPHPVFVDGATGTAIPLTPNVNTRVTNLLADWTFGYTNDTVVAAGTYGGVNANNSRVTYTASMP